MKLRTLLAAAILAFIAAPARAQENPPPPAEPAAPQAPEPQAQPPAPLPSDTDNSSLIRFAYGGDVAQIPAEFVSNFIFLPVSINQSSPSLFLLDSTSPTSSIDPKRAAAIGLAADPSTGAAENVFIEFPGVRWQVASLRIAPRDGISPLTGRVYQGTLGLDFLSKVVIEIDYLRRTVQIYDPHSYTPPGKRVVQPVKWAGGLPYVPCKFSIHGEHSATGLFLVNSAQSAGIVFRDQFVSAHVRNFEHLKTIPGMYGTDAGVVPAAIGRIESFGVEKFESPNMIAVIPHGAMEDSSNTAATGVIGGAYLRRFVLVFDLPHQQIVFEPNIHFIDRDDAGMSGLTLVARGPNHKTFEVAFVDPDSPAAHAGIQTGDVIAGVNDEAAADLTLDQVQEMFRRLAEKYKVIVVRKDQTLTVNFQTRRLI